MFASLVVLGELFYTLWLSSSIWETHVSSPRIGRRIADSPGLAPLVGDGDRSPFIPSQYDPRLVKYLVEDIRQWRTDALLATRMSRLRLQTTSTAPSPTSVLVSLAF